MSNTNTSPTPNGDKKRNWKMLAIVLGAIAVIWATVVIYGLVTERAAHGPVEDLAAEAEEVAEVPPEAPEPIGDGTAMQEPESSVALSASQKATVDEAKGVLEKLLGSDNPVVKKFGTTEILVWKVTHEVARLDGSSGPVYSSAFDGKIVLAPRLFSSRQVGRGALLLARLYEEGYWSLDPAEMQKESKRLTEPASEFRFTPALLVLQLFEAIESDDSLSFKWKQDIADIKSLYKRTVGK